LFDYFIESIFWIDDIDLFTKLEAVFPESYQDSIGSTEFTEMLARTVKHELGNTKENFEDLRQQIHSISSKFGITFYEEIEELNIKIARANHEADQDRDIHVDLPKDIDPPELSENRQIEEIFNSLIE
jgi:hypothetical protein